MVNGMTGKVLYCDGEITFFKCRQNIVPIFPVYCNRIPYYPIAACYLSTIHKVIGQTLPHLSLVFNCRYFSPAVGYVVLYTRLILSI